MKNTILITIALLMLGSIPMKAKQIINTSFTDSIVTNTFGVRGNCGMCKATIEKAALSISGVNTASWDATKKVITVTYDSKITNLKAIHKAIALSGYDTEMVKADEVTYSKLPGCCQYERDMQIPKTELD